MAVNVPQLRQVVFNEGEPLDPNKLNDLAANIKTAYDLSVANMGTDGTYKVNLDTGRFSMTLKDGVALSDPITNASMTSPQLIASIGSFVSNDTQVTLTLEGGNRIKLVSSPKSAKTIWVNWILAEKGLTS